MMLQSLRELEVTREKLRQLEELYSKTQATPAENAYAREPTLRSLQHTINQLKEQIARFQARAGSSTTSQ
jgi:hypothetical protein